MEDQHPDVDWFGMEMSVFWLEWCGESTRLLRYVCMCLCFGCCRRKVGFCCVMELVQEREPSHDRLETEVTV